MTVERPAAPWPTASTAVVGVMGDPVAHSLSPLLHNAAFAALGLDWASVAFLVRPGGAEDALRGMRALGVRGLSVTMPHKSAAAALADRLTPVAERLGAANCLSFDGGEVLGDNTDGEGFLAALRRGTGFDPAGRRCLVAGAGGAARAVVLALAAAGASEVVVANRSPDRAEAAAALAGPGGRLGEAAEAPRADLVVNATPAGMVGAGEAVAPIVDAALLHAGQVVVDLVYEPRTTAWLSEAVRRGATGVGGLGMLVHQAAVQLERWTGRDVPVEVMWDAARRLDRPSGAVPAH